MYYVTKNYQTYYKLSYVIDQLSVLDSMSLPFPRKRCKLLIYFSVEKNVKLFTFANKCNKLQNMCFYFLVKICSVVYLCSNSSFFIPNYFRKRKNYE